METLQTKLFEAATHGSINSLHKLLKDDPLILDRASVSCFNDTPLHVAAMLGHIDFVKEIMRIKPHLVDELNSQQSTALHLAAAKGHVEVVRTLLSTDVGACLALDRNELTPLHLAAAKGRIEVLKLLLEAQPDAARIGENIMRLCVKHHQLQAMKLLVNSLGQKAFINSADACGNTLLHLAVADKQVETVRYLVGVGAPAVEVKTVNDEGMTALDVLIRSKRDVRDSDIENILKLGGGECGTLENNNTGGGGGGKEEKKSLEGLLKQHEKWREEKKSALMVVAVLIATMAFQIGVNPPGGVWQDDKTDSFGLPLVAGSSVYAHKYPLGYRNFYIINTIAFIASLSVILLLMSGLPLRRRLFMWILMFITWIAITTIALCYVSAIVVLTPDAQYGSVDYVIGFTVIAWVILMGCLLIAHTIRMIVKLIKKMRKRRGGRVYHRMAV